MAERNTAKHTEKSHAFPHGIGISGAVPECPRPTLPLLRICRSDRPVGMAWDAGFNNLLPCVWGDRDNSLFLRFAVLFSPRNPTKFMRGRKPPPEVTHGMHYKLSAPDLFR